MIHLRNKIFQTPIHPSISYDHDEINLKDTKIDIKNGKDYIKCKSLDNSWECETCEAMNEFIDLKCKSCGVRKVIQDWNCNGCGSSNPFHYNSCQICQIDRIPIEEQKNALIKFSFKGSGFNNFLSHLQIVMSKQDWKQVEQSYMCLGNSNFASLSLSNKKILGISGIMEKKKEMLAQSQTQIDESFKDLDSLISQATEMVDLAMNLKNKLESRDKDKGNEDDNSNSERKELRELLLEIGIVGSFTKDTATGNLYYQEMAKELAEFILRLFSIKTLKIIPLTDVYCLFNKARGSSAFVSPKDLRLSAEIMEQLGMPITLRKLKSGEFILQSKDLKIDNMAKVIKESLIGKEKLKGGKIERRENHFGIESFSQDQNLSLSLCSELLEEIERAGHICRDQSLYGILYYSNMIIESTEI